MAFNNYLEDENDKPYFNLNSLAYYYDKMEGFAEKVEQAAKILNVTKEEVEKNITAYIEQNKNELDQRLAQWDGKLETFDSSVETLLSEWVDDGTLTPLIDSTLIDQKISPLTLQLAGKLDKDTTELSLNNFKETDRAVIQGLEPGQINAVLGKENVKLENLAILKKSTNLFNEGDVLNNTTLSRTSGVTSTSEGFVTSSKIPISGVEKVIIKHARVWALYDSNGLYVSGKADISAENNIIVAIPSTAEILQISWMPSATSPQVSEQQINAGGVLLTYEPWYQYIDKQYVEKPEIELSDMPDIPAEKINFMKKSTNLFNEGDVYLNSTLSRTSGSVTPASNFVVSGFIPFDSEKGVFVKHARVWVLSDENENYLTGSADIAAKNDIYIPPFPNAKYLRISWMIGTSSPQISEQQVNAGDSLLPFENFNKRTIPSEYLPNSTSGEEDQIKVTLPPKIYGVVGKEISVYFENLLSVPLKDVQIDISGTEGKQLSDKWIATPTVSGTYQLSVSVYKNYQLVTQAQTELIVKTESVGSGVTKNLMIIGDSTVTQGWMIERTENLFSTDPLNINFIGTRGNEGLKHEGRAGWNTADYRTDKLYMDEPNPFYNAAVTDFDFNHYMTTQSTGVPNYVSIVLGINDAFAFNSDNELLTNVPQFLANLDHMVSSIKAYNPNIIVGIAVTIPPVANQDQFGEAYNRGQVQWRYKRNNAFWISELVKHYRTRNDVHLIPENSHFDAHNGLRDGVHPNAEIGDKMRGETYYYWLKSFEA